MWWCGRDINYGPADAVALGCVDIVALGAFRSNTLHLKDCVRAEGEYILER
jgi:hypothetical protein